ncbi:vitamin B12 transporter [Tamilnaduibacter salinus]|uniref:Vitamin B12 transporter n=1 Tax=Tamilnaduibacter salinus TaxID=1484056 RepID=A0A2U1CXL9_9GAMM|nr:TonB-dependent receptor [Tamilnaduibacter salinus]PVY76978.1 vitamin B12 transporter [Tamilnaduibacter salinus]
MTTPTRLSLAIAITLAPLAVEAEELDPIVVTSAKTVETVNQSNASVTTFTREDIENSPANTLDELLIGIPGISVANSGGYGKQTSLFTRGTESNHTLVMVDGVRINTAQEGAGLIQHIPLSQVERVEVVRGPRSSLYGSDALGGVVQVFSRRPDVSFEGMTELTAGTEDTYGITQYLGGAQDGTRWDLTVSGLQTGGNDAQKGFEPDDDGFDNASINGGFESQVTDNAAVGARLYQSEGRYEFDQSSTMGADKSDFLQRTLQAYTDLQLSDRTSLNLTLSEATERRRDYVDDQPQGKSTIGTQTKASATLDYVVLANMDAKLGFERTDDDYDQPTQQGAFGPTPAIDEERFNNAVFGQLLGGWKAFSYQLGLRHDNNEQFGEHTTGNAVIGYEITPAAKPYASYGTAFVTPTFVDLYFPGFSNPNLDPEQGETAEIGLKGSGDHWRYSIAAFYSEIEDLIVFPGSQPENVDSSYIRGGEASVAYDWNQWWFELAAGYTRAVNADSDEQLIRRPKWSGRASARYEISDVSLRADVRSQGHSHDTDFAAFQRVRMAGFAVTDLSASWKVRDGVELEAKARNVFDQEAETVFGYNDRGRLVTATIRFRY